MGRAYKYSDKCCLNCRRLIECQNINPGACDGFEQYYCTHVEIAEMCHVKASYLSKMILLLTPKAVLRWVRDQANDENICIERERGRIIFARGKIK